MANGEYIDDLSIRDDSHLWRRIPPDPPFLVFDQNRNCKRLSSAAFQDHKRTGTPMSVAIAQVAMEHNRGTKEVLKDHAGFGLAGLVVKVVREHGLGVCKKPLPNEPEHGEVFGPKPKSVSRQLALAAFWVVEPGGLN